MLNIFKIRKDERWLMVIATLFFSIMNAVTVAWYWTDFSRLTDNYHKLFVTKFHVSGFDPLTYEVISKWDTAFNIYRHPLLAFFMWPFSMINKGLIWLTGVNCATILTALILIFCASYSALFVYRIFREVIQLRNRDTWIMTMLTFSMAYIILSAMVPDHFIMSMFALTLTLYISGRKLRGGSALNMWQTIMLFVVTAGISLNNGLKIFLAALVTRRRRFFEWKFLLLAVLLPSALIWGFARWEYHQFAYPEWKARQEVKMKKNRELTAQIRKKVEDSLGTEDKAKVDAEVKKIIKEKAWAKKKRDSKKIWNANTGKPFMKGEFMSWTDKTTSRWDVGVECLLGEGIQLHRDHLLGDVLRDRPVIVRYDTSSIFGYINYIVEAIIVLLFLAGVWIGRKTLFLWTAMSFLLMDVTLHMGLGFGINEVQIMSAHYLFVLPIAMAYLVKKADNRYLSYSICGISLWLLGWNLFNIMTY